MSTKRLKLEESGVLKINMRRSYYIEQFNCIWSFSLEGYKLFLENGAAGKEWT